MTDRLGSFVTERDGVQFFTNGIIHSGTSIEARIGYVNFGYSWDGISDTGGFFVSSSSQFPIANVDSTGEVRIGGGRSIFDAGVVRYSDGTLGVFGGLGLSSTLAGLSLSLHGGGGNSSNNLSTYNHINVYSDGRIERVEYSSGNSTYPGVMVTVTPIDRNGAAIGSATVTNIPPGLPIVSQMAAGTAPKIYDSNGYWGNRVECFPASTPIAISPTETRPICDILVGDTVLAFDPAADLGRGALVPRKVVRLYRNTTEEWVRLTWAEGGEQRELVTTPGHHFLDRFGNFPSIAEMIENGKATVVLASGELTEVTAERITYSAQTAHLFEQAQAVGMVAGNAALKPAVMDAWQTYNFEVEDLHTYVAGGVRVHNESGLLGKAGNWLNDALDTFLSGRPDANGDGWFRDKLAGLLASPAFRRCAASWMDGAEVALIPTHTALTRNMGLTASPIIHNSMVNTGLRGDSGVRIRRKIGRAAIAAMAASTFGLCSPVFAQERREPPTVVVYGDDSRDWVAEVQRFTDILDPRDRPIIVAGDTITSFPTNVTLIWFGDLSHEPTETADVPEALRVVADHLGKDVRDGSAGLADGEIRLGANCYTQSIDRSDGLPEIAVNFSDEDPQGFCKGLTIAHVLLSAGRWMRNEGSGCLLRNCEIIRFGE